MRRPLGVVFIQLLVAGAAVDGVTPKSWNTGYEHFLEYFMEENAWFAPYEKFDEKVSEIKGGFFKMKKALAVLLALGMVFAAFADAPAADLSVVSVTGNAALEWISDLEAKTNGFANPSEWNVKINLFNGGDVATSGDGVWGELKVEIETPDALENPGALTIGKTAEVKTAKIHFVDGDVGIALNILKPGLALGENVLPTAVGADVKSAKFDVASLAPASAAYKTAKDDYDAAVKDLADLKKTDYTADALLAAERAVAAAKKTLDETAAPAALTNGFALEITSSVIDANFKVMDNGVAADKEWGFGADATIKAVENLNLKAGFAYAYEKTAFVASVDYKLGINDSLYLKPAVSFGLMDETKQLVLYLVGEQKVKNQISSKMVEKTLMAMTQDTLLTNVQMVSL